MTKHKSSDERREQILTAARRCFVERGYEATRMQDISRESGLSKGGIYFHFDSKMQVFLALVDEEYQNSMGFMSGIASSGESADEKFSVLASHYLSQFASQRDTANFFIVMSEVALREPVVKKKLADLQEGYFTVLSEFIQDGIDAGTFKQIDPRSVAIFMKSLIDGLEGNIALGLEVDLPTLIPAGVTILLSGLLNTDSPNADPTVSSPTK